MTLSLAEQPLALTCVHNQQMEQKKGLSIDLMDGAWITAFFIELFVCI